MTEAAERPAEGVAAVDRALSILAAWQEDDGALTLATLAARTGLYKSTILRLLASLERFRCVERHPDGRWSLGPALFQWGMRYRSGLTLDAVPFALQQLAQDTGESASFWVRRDGMRCCLFRAESPRPVRDHLLPGAVLPLDNTATGLVLREFALGRLVPAARLRVSLGERDPDTAALAAPVFDASGALAGALALSGPRARIEAALHDLKPLLLQAAAALTRRLGGDPGEPA